MNNCEKYYELISSLLDNEITPDEKEDLEEHLKTCEHCASVLELYKTLFSDNELVDPPENFVSAVMQDVSAHEKKKSKRKAFVKYSVVVACLAAILAVSVVTMPDMFNLQRYKDFFNTSKDDNEAINGRTDYQNMISAIDDILDEAGDDTPYFGSSADSSSQDSVDGSSNAESDSNTSQGSDKNSAALTDENDYFAVVNVSGTLPSIFKDFDMEEYDDGSYRIVVPSDMIDQIEALDSSDVSVSLNKSPSESDYILVIYTP